MKRILKTLNAHLGAVLLICGGTALAVGIGMIALPAGVIAAGVELIFAGVLVYAGDAYAKAGRDGDVSG